MLDKEQGDITEAPMDPRDRKEPTFGGSIDLPHSVVTSTPKVVPKVSTPIAKPSSFRSAVNGNMNNAQQKRYFGGLIKTAILWAALYYGITAWINHSVVSDSISEFKITQQYGSKIEQQVHAGIVAAAMLQKGDAEGYRRWKAIEDSLKTR